MFRALVFLFSIAVSGSLMAQEWMYIASRADEKVYRCVLNAETGEMTDLQTAADEIRSEFFANHPTLPVLYVGMTDNELKKQGKPPAGISAFQVDAKAGTLAPMGTANTNDNGNTHIAISTDGRTILSVAYGGKGTRSLRINEKGVLVAGSGQNIAHEGSSVHERQKTHHPHGCAIHQDGKFCCVADMGNEHIEIYSIDADSNIAKHSRWKAADGAGPRHATFHPNGKWLYCINELNGTIDVLNFDATAGELSHVQTISTLPKDFQGKNTTAEIAIHPSGKFVYGSNRGHDSTAVYSVNPDNGELTLVEHEPTGGEHPRFVGLNTDGTIFIAANMHSDNMVSFFVDQETGALKPTGHKIDVNEPRGVGFVLKIE